MAATIQTENAAERISSLLSRKREQSPVSAVRIGIKARGCNGLSYTMDYATDKKKLEEEVNQHGACHQHGQPKTPHSHCSRPVASGMGG